MRTRVYKKKNCTNCGKEFTPLSSRGYFCSHKCNIDYKTSKTEIKICPICKKEFKHLRRVTCSDKCYFLYVGKKAKLTNKKRNNYNKIGDIRRNITCNDYYGEKKSKELRKKMSESRLEGFRSGKISNTLTKYYLKGNNFNRKYKYKENYFRSNWEVKVVKWLDDNNITWEYETKNCLFKLSSGRYYIIDFFLPELNKWIEVRGFWDKNSIKKCDEFVTNNSFNSLIVIDGDNINDISLNDYWSDKSKYCFKYEECRCEK